MKSHLPWVFESTDVSVEGFFSLHKPTPPPLSLSKSAAIDLIGFVLFIPLISTSLLSPLQMRVRWGGSGFDDLKCTQLTSYSYSAQLLWQFNSFLPVLLMLTCQGWSGGRRPRNCSIIPPEMLSGSEDTQDYTRSSPALIRLDLMTISGEFS